MRLVLLLLLASCSTPTCEPHEDPAPKLGARSFSWKDPVSGTQWAISATEVIWSQARDACMSPWRLPETWELRDAWTRGLQGPTVWGVGVSSEQALIYDFTTAKLAILDKTKKAGTACSKSLQP